MHDSLFTYGTLMFPAVVRRLAGRTLATQPAVLRGFARHALRGARYPGLVPAPDACVAGLVAHGVWPALLAKLDRWEGDEYVRERVRVAMPGAGHALAWVYVLAPQARGRALARDRDADAFARRHLSRWQRAAARFAAREIRA
jgi:gamma-glutamylcyclotransferase (GGCT)/AIG2-like uncharacterized protein YtfP